MSFISSTVLTQEQVEQIRAKTGSTGHLAVKMHVSRQHAQALHDAPTLEDAMQIVQMRASGNGGRGGGGGGNGHVKDASALPTAKDKEGGGQLVTVAARRPAPIVFRVGDQNIDLNPQSLYEAYILYLDLKTRLGLTDDFATVIKDAVGLAWRHLIAKPKVDDHGNILMEVRHG